MLGFSERCINISTHKYEFVGPNSGENCCNALSFIDLNKRDRWYSLHLPCMVHFTESVSAYLIEDCLVIDHGFVIREVDCPCCGPYHQFR